MLLVYFTYGLFDGSRVGGRLWHNRLNLESKFTELIYFVDSYPVHGLSPNIPIP